MVNPIEMKGHIVDLEAIGHQEDMEENKMDEKRCEYVKDCEWSKKGKYCQYTRDTRRRCSEWAKFREIDYLEHKFDRKA